MQESLITFETAKLAKEKGFNLKQAAYYNEHADLSEVYSCYCNDKDVNECSCGAWESYDEGENAIQASTQCLLQKWLRETHNIDVEVARDSEVHYQDETRWIVKVSNWNDIQVKEFSIAHLKFPNHSHHTDFKSYGEALEKGLIEGLNFIDNESI